MNINDFCVSAVPGLYYIPKYISQDNQKELLNMIDAQPWLNVLKRRVQHYGYKYDYSFRTTDSSMHLGSLPEWVQHLIERFNKDGLVKQPLDQLIVNEYLPGQGIGSHMDSLDFDDTVLSVSLGSYCVMTFTHVQEKKKYSMMLEPGSLLVMQDEARYKWQHEISARKTDLHQGIRITRTRRVSLTFRSVKT